VLAAGTEGTDSELVLRLAAARGCCATAAAITSKAAAATEQQLLWQWKMHHYNGISSYTAVNNVSLVTS
jgi:hypothetical protein